MRNENLGLNDTVFVYKRHYYEILTHNFKYIFLLKDYGFQLITFLLTRLLHDNFKVYCLVIVIPYISSVSYIIYKYSKFPCISFILFICLQYFSVAFTLMRQTMGMAILLFSVHLLIKKRNIEFCILVIIASFFHAICIVFLSILVLKYVRFKKWMFIPLGLIVLYFLFFPNNIMRYIYFLITDERFAVYESARQTKNLTLFFTNIMLWSCITIRYHKAKYITGDRKIMYICSSLAVVISPLTIALGEMSRIAYLFGIINIVVFPDFIEVFKKGRERQILVGFMCGLLIIYFMLFLGPQVNIIPYYF